MSAIATRPRLGFLGVGWIGRNRLEAIERAGVAEIAGVSDPALPESQDLGELDLDGIVIATPSALHAEQAIAAFERGLAVFCQKPLARTADEARRVVAAARSADRLLAVDLSYRHVRAFQAAREVVRSGDLGEIVAAELVFHNAYGPDKAWFRDPSLAGGGCLIDLGIHLVDLALWTLGDLAVDDVRLAGAPVEDYASARLGPVAIACSWNLHAGADAVIAARFHGRDGGAEVTNVGGSFYDFRCDRLRGTRREPLVDARDDWMGRAAVVWAERLARGDRFDAASAAEIVRVHEILDDLYRRAR
ncbi:MAG: Gfo/Idh/MocA family protein [Gaiellaceae bacterium]